jgi:maltose/maltodextrin transport system substrate-binding protein/arabinogalactan oligomer/maltooligosaccharide transport system substrate-binding protein
MIELKRPIGLIAAAALALAACSSPAATQPAASLTPTAAATDVATDEPTEAPASEPAASPTESEPAASPTESEPAASPSEIPSEVPSVAPASPGASPSPSPAPVSEEGTLTIWADEVRAPILTELGEAFTAEYDVPVQVYQLGFGDIRDQLALRGPAQEGPDIIIGAHDWLGQLAEGGLVAPIDLGAKADSFDEVALEAFTYDGELYGMPYAAEAIALYYNTELVPEPPETWDDLKEIAQQLQDDGSVEQGYVLQTGPADPYHSYPILSGHGGYIFGQDDSGAYDPSDVGLDSEGGLAYARELDQMIKDGILRPDVDYDVMMDLFLTGRSAMFMTGPWALGDLRNPERNTAGVEFDVAPIPTMEEQARPFAGVQGFMVSAFAANQLLAQTFLTEYVATDDTMGELFAADPRPPTWLPIRETIDDEQVLAFVESASTADPMPAIPEMSSVWTAWTDALNLIFQQAEDPEQAMQDAATEIRGLIGQ